MQVPYATKWHKEAEKLRKIALDCDLTEETKWGKPCFTFLKKNIAIVIPLKDSCAFSFFKGALLHDPERIPPTHRGAHPGRPLDQVHLGQRDRGTQVHPHLPSTRYT